MLLLLMNKWPFSGGPLLIREINRVPFPHNVWYWSLHLQAAFSRHTEAKKQSNNSVRAVWVQRVTLQLSLKLCLVSDLQVSEALKSSRGHESNIKERMFCGLWLWIVMLHIMESGESLYLFYWDSWFILITLFETGQLCGFMTQRVLFSIQRQKLVKVFNS